MSPNDREQPLSETEVADARTLVLSAVQLTPALLDQFVGYQRALVKLRAEAPKGLHEADRHRLELEAEIAAQQGSGLSLRQTHQLSAMARDILGRLWTWRELNRRKAELEAQKTGSCSPRASRRSSPGSPTSSSRRTRSPRSRSATAPRTSP